MPFGGDPSAVRDARLDAADAHQAGATLADTHIVDIYLVRCPEGGVYELFVCKYHCARGQSPY